MLYKTKDGRTFKAMKGIYTFIQQDGTVKVRLGKFNNEMNFINIDAFEEYLGSAMCILFKYHKEVA